MANEIHHKLGELHDIGDPANKTSIPVTATYKNGVIWLGFEGYGEPEAPEGQGTPVGLEYYEGELRVIVYDDINRCEPKVIPMEEARESAQDLWEQINREMDQQSSQQDDETPEQVLLKKILEIVPQFRNVVTISKIIGEGQYGAMQDYGIHDQLTDALTEYVADVELQQPTDSATREAIRNSCIYHGWGEIFDSQTLEDICGERNGICHIPTIFAHTNENDSVFQTWEDCFLELPDSAQDTALASVIIEDEDKKELLKKRALAKLTPEERAAIGV